jgi:hypothetical protein
MMGIAYFNVYLLFIVKQKNWKTEKFHKNHRMTYVQVIVSEMEK